MQHQAFLDQVIGTERASYLDWFWTQPLWLDLGGLRVVHACWHDDSIDVVRNEVGTNRLTGVEHLVLASRKATRSMSR